MFLNTRHLLAPAILLLSLFTAAGASDMPLSGLVRDENDAPVAQAQVVLRQVVLRPVDGSPNARRWQALTDPAGAFSLLLPAGDYTIGVAREGFHELKAQSVHLGSALELRLTLNHVREVFQSVNVEEPSSPVDLASTRNAERLSGTAINDLAYANSQNLRNSMKLMPGVLQDSRGMLHQNGASEEQVQYLLNGFNLSDPLTGQFQTSLAVEGIRSLEYSSGRYSPEFGKGSAGAMAISTQSGTDDFRYTATNFIPGIDIRQGVRLGNWYPRFGVSGPIRRGRAWFADTFESEYNNALITGLPAGQNTRSSWTGSNLLHTQVNLTPRHILFADFLANVSNKDRVGLGPLDPIPTTQTVRSREYFASVKDQFFPGGGWLAETGYAHNEFRRAQTPQGQDFYVFSPEGRSGNYFVTSDQRASRDQAMAHVYFPQFALAGTHQIEAGTDLDFLGYSGNNRRTGYDLIGPGGWILSRTTFSGPGAFHVNDTEFALWVLDTWRIARRIRIDAGFRQDWDRLVRNQGWSPRVAVSWAPFRDERTRLAAGYAVTRDAVTLDPFGRVLDQVASTVSFDSRGVPSGPPALTTFEPATSKLRLPRAVNWTLSADRELGERLFGSLRFLRRRSSSGFDFLNTLDPDAPPSLLPLPNGAAAGTYRLANLRRDDYDSVQVSVRHNYSDQHQWMASYTWSRAHSNAVLDENSAVPLQVLPQGVPMPWDAPHRFLAWAYLPVSHVPRALGSAKEWSVAALVDARTGFPWSIQQSNGLVSGDVDAQRFPFSFSLNLALERLVTFRGYRFALRGGADNVTGRRNPAAVNNVVGSPQFRNYFGDEGRHFVVRIRFFGRAGAK